MLRLSTLFLRTLRDDPGEAEVASHRLLLRGGYVRRVAPGIFSWLPLGLLVLRNIEAVIRAEMARIGAQEVHLPALLPRDPYEQTGRWSEYGGSLFRLQDRREADMLLGPTHEEIFTLLVKGETSSYRDLPLYLYQIQTKFRDELRPRAGILRGREFLMKDSYSFDVDDAGLRSAYAKHRKAYVRIFEKLHIDTVIVAATSGAMGGSASEEFLAPCEAGEDEFVRCSSCTYAANVEAVVVTADDTAAAATDEPPTVIETPGAKTIDTLVAQLGDVDAGTILKIVLVVLVSPDGVEEPLAIGVPADRDVDEKRLEAQVAPATVRAFAEADFAANPTLVRGYVGPAAVGVGSPTGIRFVVDPRVSKGTAWITGGDAADRHVRSIVRGRDFEPDGEIQAATVRAGDPCPKCASALRIDRGIEIGHVFQLGRKYAEALGLQVSGPDGQLATVTMGSYGIGVSRAVATIAEQHHDDLGLLWPAAVAPAKVHIVVAGRDDATYVAAEALAKRIGQRDVLLDDRRDASPGVKFSDAELLGMPVIVVVGKRLVDGMVEIRSRRDRTSSEVRIEDAPAAVKDLLRSL